MKNRIGEKQSKGASSSGQRQLLLVVLVVLVSLVATRSSIGNVQILFSVQDWDDSFPTQARSVVGSSTAMSSKRITIAYAVSVTGCSRDDMYMIHDGAAVVHQSIRLASRDSRYDYHMIAFVHPGAKDCVPMLNALGYEVQIRDTPFNDTDIHNPELALAQENSCCGTKEYLKLYSYLQVEFPVVVHLDLDCLVLKPMDDIFDLMLDREFNRSRVPVMHRKPTELPERIDFVFTRDYGMVEPGVRLPHQIGVQGGFLVFRPNETDFYRNIEIIQDGANFSIYSGWGGQDKAYGGYYGAGTIQGLASYYYGEISPNRSVEVNRCYFNNMADDPYGETKNDTCRTLESECDDCRAIHVKDVITTHFTNCGKPFWCSVPRDKRRRICTELLREWHLVRLSLENEWSNEYPDYHPIFATDVADGIYLNFSQGHCQVAGDYIAMQFPNVTSEIQLLPTKHVK